MVRFELVPKGCPSYIMKNLVRAFQVMSTIGAIAVKLPKSILVLFFFYLSIYLERRLPPSRDVQGTPGTSHSTNCLCLVVYRQSGRCAFQAPASLEAFCTRFEKPHLSAQSQQTLLTLFKSVLIYTSLFFKVNLQRL